MHVTYRKTCRICGSSALTKVIDLGAQHLQGSFIKPSKPLPPLRKISTALVRCDPTTDENACGLLQAQVSVPPEILYASYWYRSGTNRTMRDHLQGVAEEAVALIGKDKALALDIGCNDGTLLKSYPQSISKIGIVPSNVAQEAGGEVEVINDFFPSHELAERVGGQSCDIITSLAMFYDLEDPVGFVQSVKKLLRNDGIWVFEVSYMPKMLELNSYDTICHEHLEYYSFSVLERLLNMGGMKMINVSFNDINGGSIRCYATHAESLRFKNPDFEEAIKEVRRREFELELDTDKPYSHFQESIERHKQELSTLLKDLKLSGKSIHIYGASTKGNTILQWCGIDNTVIDYASDRNAEKDGAKTIGTEIPIISEKKSRAMKPDYYLVLPWHFRKEFLERETEMLRQGTKMIFPLPEVEIVEV